MQNKAKVSRYSHISRTHERELTQHRRIIQCALSSQHYDVAREVHAQMANTGRDEPVTRYLMYKVGLRSQDNDFGMPPIAYSQTTLIDVASECLDYICRTSVKDATLLYACVMEAQSAGSKRQVISALEKVLSKYEHSAPSGIHLPALLR